VILTCQQGRWYAVFSVEAEFAETCGTGMVGIDLGLNNLIVLDRDVAAATVVHQRAFGPGHGPRDMSQRVAA
jgi:putative transposase